MLQQRLLKVLEDKRVTFESSYYDENAPNVPEYVQAPVPRRCAGGLHPHRSDDARARRHRSRRALALREIYFEPLTQSQVVKIAQGAIKRLGATADRGIPKLIASYTIEGRKAVQIVADAFGQALSRRHEASRLAPRGARRAARLRWSRASRARVPKP